MWTMVRRRFRSAPPKGARVNRHRNSGYKSKTKSTRETFRRHNEVISRHSSQGIQCTMRRRYQRAISLADGGGREGSLTYGVQQQQQQQQQQWHAATLLHSSRRQQPAAIDLRRRMNVQRRFQYFNSDVKTPPPTAPEHRCVLYCCRTIQCSQRVHKMCSYRSAASSLVNAILAYTCIVFSQLPVLGLLEKITVPLN